MLVARDREALVHVGDGTDVCSISTRRNRPADQEPPFDAACRDGCSFCGHRRRESSARAENDEVAIGMRYRADIAAGSLKLPESRVIADRMLRGVDAQSWEDAIIGRNVLQVRNPATAHRWATLIDSRLSVMEPSLWLLVRDAKGMVAIHAMFAAYPV